MTTIETILSTPAPTTGDPNSIAAAASIEPTRKGLLLAVMRFLTERGEHGATCDEVEAALGMSHQSTSARVNELMKAGAIVPRGKRATRSGRKAWVWVVPS